MRKMIDIPPVWLALFMAAAWWQQRLVPLGSPLDGTAKWVMGGLLIAAGVVLVVLAAQEFRRARTTIIPHLAPSHLITSGIFSRTRNPIYLADALILTGFVVLIGAWPSLVLVPLFVLWIDRRFIRDEEARLRTAFPDEFGAYEQKVRRWL